MRLQKAYLSLLLLVLAHEPPEPEPVVACPASDNQRTTIAAGTASIAHGPFKIQGVHCQQQLGPGLQF